ncbi:serine aminopeptidase domain-containing protein [Hymenobacter negativus]|uniref:Alpha/beta hydrolase n=1 Tax=Hymenobacter negativus TaxID=2795026 RepID=A0ABS0Q7M0_9BACT|nr:alpha/beta hydrolase [Hymenobacter negativus]MBH8558602.1 alpha/beta hydrolase [Hymenobacter negativus]
MKFIYLSVISALSLATIQAAPIGTGQMLGQWAGTLPVPGGSRQVFISVSALADGTPTAMLRMDAGRLQNSPMRVVNTADSVVFFADKAGCRFAGRPVADGQRLRGQWQQPGFRAMLVLDRVTAEKAADKTAEISEAPASYRTEEVHVSSTSSPSPEIGLGGTLRLPAGTGPFPAVVLLPDVNTPEPSTGDYGLLNALADYLTRQGVAVLRLDDRGTGRSVGVPAATAGPQLVADAQSAMAYLRAKSGIDPLRVGLLGHGEGANVALLAGAQAPAPAFLVALGAAGVNGQELLARQTSLVNQPGEPDTAQLAWATQAAQAMAVARREAKKQLAAGANPAQTQLHIAQEQLRLTTEARKRNDALYKRQYALLEIIRQTADNAQAQAIVANMLKQIYPALSSAAAQTRASQLTSPWYRSFLTFNPQAELGKVACPTLLLHGTADTQVQLAANLPVLEKGLKANKRVNVQKLDGLNHEFQAPLSEQALAAGTTVRPTAAPDALEAVGEWVMQQVK